MGYSTQDEMTGHGFRSTAKMMQAWAGYLDGLKAGGRVATIKVPTPVEADLGQRRI